ncbi:MAG: type VI secretion system membrane subunit TssM [Chromatiaceae bacterium]|nr:MAG: type VI secretion system membrane subunit TssM [Chromatiaceae bacterium]
MTSLLSLLTSGSLLSLTGVAALGALVWYLGPLLAIAGYEPLASPANRLWLIGGLLLLWLLWQLIKLLLARRRNRRLMQDLAGDSPAADATDQAKAEELATLQGRFGEALALLKRTEGRKGLGGRWVYELPWYLIIGPPGCGKTTALNNSGLRFPLAEQLGQAPIQGVGGTRNCDWFFTDQAVLLDTAGRYTTQDSHSEVDRAAWQGFLALLKKHRPRRPVNGVLLALSLADILQWSAAERSAHARAIGLRLQEIYASFRIRVPVYVLFMKADLVAGFMEFFADLNKEGRAQVWGVTFPFDAAASATHPAGGTAEQPLTHFPAEHLALVQRLEQHWLRRLQEETEVHRRRLLFGFPRQFASLGDPINRFLHDCLVATRFEQRPLVRGVYFTSATQTGTPIDRVLASISANFGVGRTAISPFIGSPKSFFVTRLLQDVVFPEAPLAGLDPRLERRRRWLRRGAYASVLLLALAVASAWTLSYGRNRAYVAEVSNRVELIQGEIDRLGPLGPDVLEVLPLLNAARDIPRGWDERDHPAPLSMRLGLYQGRKLGTQSERTYRRTLYRALLPTLVLNLEAQVREALQHDDQDQLYGALRAYLMLDDARHYDPDEIRAWIGERWASTLPRGTTSKQLQDLAGHLAALFETRPTPLPLALDQPLIERARAALQGAPLATRVYERLQAEGTGLPLPEFTITAAAGDRAALVLERRSRVPLNQGIPALYTAAGYTQGFDAATDRLIAAATADSWVLGPGAELTPDGAGAVKAEVRERYLRDYVQQWNGLLGDIAVVAARDLLHAATLTEVLTDPAASPLRRLLLAAAQETNLRPATVDEEAAADADGGIAAALRARLAAGRSAGDHGAADADPEAYVRERFKWLHDLVTAADGQPSRLDRALNTVAQTAPYLRAVKEAIDDSHGPLTVGTGAELTAAVAAAAAQPPVPAGILSTLLQDSANLVAADTRARLNNIWTAEILPFCREAIAGRYPFTPGSRRDSTLADFARLFGPSGLLADFFRDHLAPLVDTSRPEWRWVNPDLGIPDSILAQFQRIGAIRDAFFGAGGPNPSVGFALTPTQMDVRATQFTLDLGGQLLDYRHGPPRPQNFTWPASEGGGRVRLAFVGIDGRTPAQTEDGAWAWFRVLDRARLQGTGQPELFRLTFSLGGLSASFELRATSVRNPFALRGLHGFACPERL